MLKFLADENLRKEITGFLVCQGHDVKKSLAGISDDEVASMARKGQRILVTHDLDFSNIFLFPPEAYFDIVVIRIIPPNVKTIINALINLLEKLKEKEFAGKLIILEPDGFRVWEN